MPQSIRRPAAALLLVLVAVSTHFRVLDLGMLGWDGWPLIAAARVESMADFWGTFGERLMDGRYPYGEFYRPLTHLSFALDEWISGLDPAGYHRTDLMLLCANTLLLAALVTRMAGGAAGLIAGLVFVLHPAQLELLPVPARRADVLALLCTMGCLLIQRDHTDLRRSLFTGLLALLAASAKETGALVAPLVVVWHLAGAGAPIAALRRSAPALLGVGVYVVARTLVLSGLGGHDGSPGLDASSTQLWSGMLGGTLPGPVMICLPALLAAAWLARKARPEGEAAALSTTLIRLGCWSLGLLAMTSFAERWHPWYALALVAPYAGVVAALIVHGWSSGTHGRVASAIAAGLVLWQLPTSAPMSSAYDSYGAASQVLAERTQALEDAVSAAGVGTTVRITQWPVVLPLDAQGTKVLALSAGYTVSAWLELHAPGKPCQVTFSAQAQDPARLQVWLVQGVPPAWSIPER